jgi:circadian clock protein KaiC
VAAAARGQRSALFIFDENVGTFRSRSRKLGIDVAEAIKNDLITVQQVDPAELSSGEFADIVRRAAEGNDRYGVPAKVIIVDSLNGYLNAMPEEKFLTAQLHELLAYLGQMGVATIMTVTQSGMVGSMNSPVDTTYLADNVLLFRYFEAAGWVRRALSVVKKRNGHHERTIRELDLDASGVQIGEPLSDFHGILTGVPSYVGNNGNLMGKK